MKHLFIGGYYDGQRMKVAQGIEQIVFELCRVRRDPGGAVRIIYTRRPIIDDGKQVYVFVLDTMWHEGIMPAYIKLTKEKNHD